VTSPADLRYAGFWLRALAAIVDLMVLAIPLSVFVSFSAVAQGIPLAFLELHPGEPPSAIISAFGKPSIFLILCFFILSGWLYFALLESSHWQGTIGKKLLGLYVADTQGNRATFTRASGRFFGGRFLVHVPYCGVLYFSVDCICAGLRSNKQALHDLIAGCLVLRKKERHPHP
jgi:uncharacterized RDD family membrane protein YckC